MDPSQPAPSQAFLDENIGYRQLAYAGASIPILLLFVGLRYYARIVSKVPFWLDDYLVGWAFILTIANSAIYIWSVLHAGAGRHLVALEITSPETITVYFKYLLACSFLYFFTVPWAKLALLALYYRIFGSNSNKIYRYAIFTIATIILLTCIVTSVWTLNICKPFAANWDRTLLDTVPGAYCVNSLDFYLYGSLPNIITDIAMLLLPIRIVWKLNTSRKNKLALTTVFILGSLGLATSILRFTFFIGTSAVNDGTYNTIQLGIWTMVEIDVYLICACLPIYRPLFVSVFGSSTRGANGPSDGIPPSQRLWPSKKRQISDTLHGHLSDSSYYRLDGNKTDVSSTHVSSGGDEQGIQLQGYNHDGKMQEEGIRVQHDFTVQSTPG